MLPWKKCSPFFYQMHMRCFCPSLFDMCSLTGWKRKIFTEFCHPLFFHFPFLLSLSLSVLSSQLAFRPLNGPGLQFLAPAKTDIRIRSEYFSLIIIFMIMIILCVLPQSCEHGVSAVATKPDKLCVRGIPESVRPRVGRFFPVAAFRKTTLGQCQSGLTSLRIPMVQTNICMEDFCEGHFWVWQEKVGFLQFQGCPPTQATCGISYLVMEHERDRVVVCQRVNFSNTVEMMRAV